MMLDVAGTTVPGWLWIVLAVLAAIVMLIYILGKPR